MQKFFKGPLLKAKSHCSDLARTSFSKHTMIAPAVASTKGTLIILGFFNRGNIGDQAYILPYKKLFGNHYDLVFQSVDDAMVIPQTALAVILAGGDVVNEYFMSKMKRLLVSYKGPCYVFSAGIPYADGLRFIPYFDHVVCRSEQDVPAVSKLIGHKNVSYLPDLTWLLKDVLPIPLPTTNKGGGNQLQAKKTMRFAICLAQPGFYKNAYEASMVDAIVKYVYALKHEYKDCEINLLSFNSSVYEGESDYVVNDKVFNKLSMYTNIINCKSSVLCDPIEMLKFISGMDILVGMRYHSIMFAMITGVKFVAMYVTKKIDNLMTDAHLNEFGYKLPHDDKFMPTNIQHEILLRLTRKRLQEPWIPLNVNPAKYNLLQQIVNTGRRQQYLVKPQGKVAYDTTLQKVETMIKAYLSLTDDAYEFLKTSRSNTATMLEKAGKSTMDLASLICFGVTSKVGSPYVWGLNENLQKDDFNFTEAIKWIYYDALHAQASIEEKETYYPHLNPKVNVVIDMNYIFQDNYQGLHRSGWSYVLGGLQHLDAVNVLKPAQIVVDGCMERTFLWGLDVLKNSGLIPYKQRWCGFIHHTFNTTYSAYNCKTMFEVPEFLQSLSTCNAIFVLSDYLRTQVAAAFKAKGCDIPVFALIHPTMLDDKKFDFSRFVDNNNRKIVQIGAWLRNSYGIYALPIHKKNKMGLRKAVLKGYEMDTYFKPENLLNDVEQFLQENSKEHQQNISRGGTIKNKHVEGLLHHLQSNDASVDIIDHLTDGEYDDLLSQNIVFINLVDASACNTVLECIVRNTPIIVNRLPALEEVLGVNYPGFYHKDNLYEAASIALDMNRIFTIHKFMTTINKTMFSLERFVNEFQAKLAACL